MTLDYHRQHPEVSLKQHFHTKVLETADRVLDRKKIYLDTWFWVRLREVCLGRSSDTTLNAILSALRSLVGCGKVICPINADILAELLKQNDQTTKLATAKLIDELSMGTAIQSEEERVGTELMHYIQLSRKGRTALEPLARLVWTSPSYVLGYTVPEIDSLEDDEMLAHQKGFTDYLWNFPLAKAVKMLPNLPEALNTHWKIMADNLNRANKEHEVNVKTFLQLHVVEFRGAMEGYSDKLARILRHVYEQQTGMRVTTTEEVERYIRNNNRKLIDTLAEALRTDKLGNQLPSLVIKSGLYAGVRWNRGKQITSNDLHDFGHATAALAYCDYFVTDKRLHHLVNELRFDQQYDVAVTSKPSEFLALLEHV